MSDLARSGAFYDAVLGALGWVRLWDSKVDLRYGRPDGGEKVNLFPNAEGQAFI